MASECVLSFALKINIELIDLTRIDGRS